MYKREQPTASRCRGVAGATIAKNESKEEVQQATRELVLAMVQANSIEVEDLAAGFVTTGSGLHPMHAMRAIRNISLEYEYLPLTVYTHGQDIGEPQRFIRVLLLWNTSKGQREIKHVYLRGTESQRSAGVGEVAL